MDDSRADGQWRADYAASMVGWRTKATRRNVAIVAAAAMLTTGACTGGDTETDPTNPTAPPTSVTSDATTTTTRGPDTTVAPTTAASTLPPTTLDPAAQLAAEVEADFREANDLLNAALMDPTDEVKVQAALEARTGFARESLEAEIQRYREGNLAIRESETVEATLTIEQPATLIPPSSDVVELVRCEIDPWVVVEVGAGPQGSDALVDDNVYARRSKIFLRRVDGTWKIEGGNREAEWVGVTECPPE
jgi:hypothetical protein